ncbi:CopG family transcriptional regulator [Asticcacaulis sp. DXS10W]|uniref:CopG family transcriptional regulator n=1 Tax=Asticcacaulis currens TaxID=2984210 RepID=A0ABT5IBC1_9CAUL|nr:CopG family transcriptional regulator [Asticcacaulis currens]MDC7693483.1 CopG family transcriptional regulator [Asticcacaulis currens]
MTGKKVRYQLFLAPAVSARLETLAAKPGLNKSAILSDAVTAWLERRASNELDAHFGKRLDRLSIQMNRMERDQLILLESLALFIRMTLLRDAHLPEADAATRALARARYEAFVAQVGRHIATGQTSLNPTSSREGE